VGQFVLIDRQGNKRVVSDVADRDKLIEAGYYNKGDWNEYHIIAEGNHIKHYLNGCQTIELIDDDPRGSAREGVLALQIHTGQPMVVEYKDIRVRHLKPMFGDAVLLFNGENLSQWQVKGDAGQSKWVVGKAAVSDADPKLLVAKDGRGEMINLTDRHGGSLDFYSGAKFGSCRIEVQLMVPQGSNSGVYVMGEYEIQVLDSYGRSKMGSGDMGAVYGAAPPPVNACKKPGEWQRYVIDVIAPQFDAAGNKKQGDANNARLVKVELNGRILHKDLPLPGPTPGGVTGTEAPEGPLMFQGNHGPVAYRNIVIKPMVGRP